MSFRLNPFKVMRAVGIVAVVTYGIVLTTGYKKSKQTTTESITKDMKVRNKDFYNSKDYKNNLTLPNQVVENNNETVAQELEQAKSAQTIDLQKNPTANNQQTQPQNNPKAAIDTKKQEEQAKLKAQKLEQKRQNLAEQRRQEEAKIEARQAEIRKQQQEAAARKEQAAAQARAEAARQHAREEAARKAKEDVARKAREDAKKRQAKGGTKKYIQVASVGTEGAAREIAKKLGGNFYYKRTSVNGRTVYVVMSNMTDNPNTLKAMENQAKKVRGGYMIRSVGK
ncbi:sporulation and cell division repeat protein [Leptotrichia trevisanii]|uniref:SPOR domain-containing protein n=1 Tax=Leptotrichia trevisanii TaxID=109328 RepID=UPI00118A5B6F|nr:SPOR domain-containing protein [Leptotrichia trevisanii]BBM56321.1 sporulation and cell division repeat protein [Leptotrichia trevisanii]